MRCSRVLPRSSPASRRFRRRSALDPTLCAAMLAARELHFSRTGRAALRNQHDLHRGSLFAGGDRVTRRVSPRELLVRGGAVVIAVVALVWLVVALLDFHAFTRAANANYSPSRSRRATARAIADTHSAQRLRPGDQTPLALRAQLLFKGGNAAAGTALLKQVVKQEPQGAFDWSALARISATVDPALARRAWKQFEKLDPVDARSRR
jgi:hypothetical protein